LPLEQDHEIGKIFKKKKKRGFPLGGEFHQNEKKKNWGCELRPLQRLFLKKMF
jgi:hypothetical protein